MNTFWSASSDAALKRLAAHRGLTRKAMLYALAAESKARLVRGWPLSERRRYYCRKGVGGAEAIAIWRHFWRR